MNKTKARLCRVFILFIFVKLPKIQESIYEMAYLIYETGKSCLNFPFFSFFFYLNKPEISRPVGISHQLRSPGSFNL